MEILQGEIEKFTWVYLFLFLIYFFSEGTCYIQYPKLDFMV